MPLGSDTILLVYVHYLIRTLKLQVFAKMNVSIHVYLSFIIYYVILYYYFLYSILFYISISILYYYFLSLSIHIYCIVTFWVSIVLGSFVLIKFV